MNITGLIGLMKLELPSHIVRLCDGGFITFGGEVYRSSDEVFGTIGSIDTLSEGVGNEIPALQMTFLPAPKSTPYDLSRPGFQTSRCRFWIGEYNPATGLLNSTPDLVFDGQLDRTQLKVGKTRGLSASVVSLAERLFALNIGNSLNDRWHQSVWPGELGHANATGLVIQVAWGTERPR